jgi:uncharacterized protein
MSFLTTRWEKLLLFNYEVEPDILLKYLPYKTEMDFLDGKCIVSLVGFMFLDTKLLGISIPFHQNFEEVNLRFYVKHKDGEHWKRGVVFIKELVPKSAISFVANTIYKEHYESVPMGHLWEFSEEKQLIEYSWETRGQKFSFSANAGIAPIENSEATFITEHYWGYTTLDKAKTSEYEVIHPKWNVYKVNDFTSKVDFGLVYGKDFESLNMQNPISVLLAEGSEISVENKRLIY